MVPLNWIRFSPHKANPKDFVEGKAKEELASKIQQLTETINFN
jgi:hypothetical protein